MPRWTNWRRSGGPSSRSTTCWRVHSSPGSASRSGGGTPPLRVGDAWLLLYHGVTGRIVEGQDQQRGVHYRAGLLLPPGKDPHRILYPSAGGILAPEAAAQSLGVEPPGVVSPGADARPA